MLRASLHAENSVNNGDDDKDDDDEVSYLIDCRRMWSVFSQDNFRSVIAAVCVMILSFR